MSRFRRRRGQAVTLCDARLRARVFGRDRRRRADRASGSAVREEAAPPRRVARSPFSPPGIARRVALGFAAALLLVGTVVGAIQLTLGFSSSLVPKATAPVAPAEPIDSPLRLGGRERGSSRNRTNLPSRRPPGIIPLRGSQRVRRRAFGFRREPSRPW